MPSTKKAKITLAPEDCALVFRAKGGPESKGALELVMPDGVKSAIDTPMSMYLAGCGLFVTDKEFVDKVMRRVFNEMQRLNDMPTGHLHDE